MENPPGNGGSEPAAEPAAEPPDPGAAHLEDFQPEPEPGQAAEGEVLGPDPSLTSAGFVTSAAFFEGFKASQEITGHFLRLEVLKTAPSQAPGSRSASDAIYEICCETPALHFMVRPELKWLQRVGAIAAYTVPLGAGVMMELRQRRAERDPAAAETAPQAAPQAPQEREAPPEDMAAVA